MATMRRSRSKMRTKTRSKVRRYGKPAGKTWRGEELTRLRNGYKTKPASKIAKELGRSLASVRGKISALKLRKSPARKARPTSRRRTRR
jgi:hypothetical protein